MNMNSFEKIKTYNGRVCIVHGTADKIVNINYAKRASEVYRNTTPEAMSEEDRLCLHIIDGVAHMFSKKNDVIAMEKLREFASL